MYTYASYALFFFSGTKGSNNAAGRDVPASLSLTRMFLREALIGCVEDSPDTPGKFDI
jgi:hypothetical protein